MGYDPQHSETRSPTMPYCLEAPRAGRMCCQCRDGTSHQVTTSMGTGRLTIHQHSTRSSPTSNPTSALSKYHPGLIDVAHQPLSFLTHCDEYFASSAILDEMGSPPSWNRERYIDRSEIIYIEDIEYNNTISCTRKTDDNIEMKSYCRKKALVLLVFIFLLLAVISRFDTQSSLGGHPK